MAPVSITTGSRDSCWLGPFSRGGSSHCPYWSGLLVWPGVQGLAKAESGTNLMLPIFPSTRCPPGPLPGLRDYFSFNMVSFCLGHLSSTILKVLEEWEVTSVTFVSHSAWHSASQGSWLTFPEGVKKKTGAGSALSQLSYGDTFNTFPENRTDGGTRGRERP
jgi:hypothetical protein